MENDFDYKLVPSGFIHCFNSQCPQADSCLRHLAAKHSAAGSQFIVIVNPAHFPAEGNKCSNFLPKEKVRIAWGITRLLDDIPYRIARQMRKMMVSHFTKSLYYRYYRKEYGISPDGQRYIRELFRKQGIKEEPVFDSYTEDYCW